VGAEADLRHAERFLTLLADLEAEGGAFSMARLEARVAGLYADTDGDPEVHVMTIHRAKGLEWDTVVLPGLGRGGGRDEPPLLLWLERQRAGAGAASDLLLAPAPERGGDKDPLYALIGRVTRDRRRAEEARLLYVAATRAKKRLHLVGHAVSRQAGFAPQTGSLLAYLWDAVGDAFGPLPAPAAAGPAPPVWGTPLPLRRLPAAWSAPEPAPAVTGANLPPPVPEVRPEYSWAGEVARAAGTVAHRALEWLAREGAEGWDRTEVRAAEPRFRAALAARGMADDDAAAAAARVEAALVTMLDDPRGRWLLGARPEGRAELSVAGILGGQVAHRTMDRTFVEGGVRWIVDYKTGRHEGADLEHFLDEEQRRYRPQIEAYARLMAALDGGERPIRLGLYFPAHGAWREWAYEVGEEAAIPA
jgi:ATP-dependent helicase/nuclease subunit A